MTSDHLGSPRITTDKDGDVYSRRDFMPFGEEVATAERTSGLNYKEDTVRQKFTTYERDDETELDFAQARMHSYNLGRFTSPDDFLNDTHPADPASWNLYVYVRNNPLRLVDPTGKIIEEENGKVKTRKRKHDPNDKDFNVETLDDGTHLLKYETTLIEGKKYVIAWAVEKVWVYADDGTPIKALKATSGIMLVDPKTGKFKSEDESMKMLQESKKTDEDLDNTTNCFGKALAKGQVWLQETGEVKKLMKGDGYDLNAKTSADVDDIGIFSDQGKNVDGMIHMVKVTASTNGDPSKVEGKNGIRNTKSTSPSSAWKGSAQLYYFSKKVKK